MAETLKIKAPLIEDGIQSAQVPWQQAFERTEAAVLNSEEIDLSAGSVVATDTQARKQVFVIVGTLTANRTFTLPAGAAYERPHLVVNLTTGSFEVRVITAGEDPDAGALIPQGYGMGIYNNGEATIGIGAMPGLATHDHTGPTDGGAFIVPLITISEEEPDPPAAGFIKIYAIENVDEVETIFIVNAAGERYDLARVYTTFLGLGDTPNVYVSFEHCLVRVNPAGTGLEFYDEIRTVNFVIYEGGAVISNSPPVKGLLRYDYPGEIVSVSVYSTDPDTGQELVGDIQIDLLKSNPTAFEANTAPVSIVAAAPPQLTADSYAENTTLTGWTKAISDKEHHIVKVISATDVKMVTLAIKIKVKVA